MIPVVLIWWFSLSIEIDSGFYTVKFDSLLMKDAVVEADGVIPPLREDDPVSSDSDDTVDEDDLGYAKGLSEYMYHQISDWAYLTFSKN